MDKSELKTNPSKYWKYYVNIFLDTLNENEKSNFILASNKFSEKEPHLYIKDIPWFKEWYKNYTVKCLS